MGCPHDQKNIDFSRAGLPPAHFYPSPQSTRSGDAFRDSCFSYRVDPSLLTSESPPSPADPQQQQPGKRPPLSPHPLSGLSPATLPCVYSLLLCRKMNMRHSPLELYCVLTRLYADLTQTGVIGEEETSTEKNGPTRLARGKACGAFS